MYTYKHCTLLYIFVCIIVFYFLMCYLMINVIELLPYAITAVAVSFYFIK